MEVRSGISCPFTGNQAMQMRSANTASNNLCVGPGLVAEPKMQVSEEEMRAESKFIPLALLCKIFW